MVSASDGRGRSDTTFCAWRQVDAVVTPLEFSGVVDCQTLVSTSVVSTSYTPGAGNVW